eukprot:2915839-Prymnesium_polylepis.1
MLDASRDTAETLTAAVNWSAGQRKGPCEVWIALSRRAIFSHHPAERAWGVTARAAHCGSTVLQRAHAMMNTD